MEEILLIEDNPADIFLIQSYLRDSSFTHRLHKAKSLHEGLEIIQHNNINIVLLDLALDDTAGFNTLRMFQQEVPTIPVIVLTGTNSELLGMQVVRAGAQDYLIKGNFDSKQLIRAIRHSILRFKAQVELREQFFAARQRDKQFQILHNLVKLGTWELDLLDNRMTWSNEMYQLLGYASSSFEPKLSDYLRIVHWEDQDKVKSFFQDAMRHSKLLQMEHRATVDQRSVRHFLLKAQVIATESSDKVILLGALQDITEFRTTANGLSSHSPELEAMNRQPLVEHHQLRHLTDQLLSIWTKINL
ncbi:MAG: response regulator [Saprospiraceae bacterium]